MPNCPFFTLGAKLSAVLNCPFTPLVPNCPRCQIVRFWLLVPNCPRCQIVRLHSWCQIVRGAKLSWCQIVLRPVSNTHELPYTDSWNEMPIKMSCRRCESNWNSGDGCWGVWHGWCWKQMFQKRTFSAILTSKSPSLSRTFLLFFLGNPLPTKTEWFISWPSAMGWANDFFLGLRPGGGRAVAEHFYKVFKIFVFFQRGTGIV